MDRCRDYDELIEKMLADEVGDADRDRLLGHAETCRDCRQFVDLHFRLREPGHEPDLPTAGEFAAARHNVMRRIRAEAHGAADSAAEGLLDRMKGWLLQPTPAIGALALLVVVAGLGYLAGRQVTGPTPLSASLRPDRGDAMFVQHLRDEARGNRALSDVEQSPYLYSNVSFDDNGDRTLTLKFDVTRHMEVRRPASDPLVQELLVQSMLGPASVGSRLDALEHAAVQSSPKVREALIVSMLNDANLAVRLRALNLLSTEAPDEEITAAFLVVLGGEDSVQMRMLALDYLAASGGSGERVTPVLNDLDIETDRPLLIRAAGLGLLLEDGAIDGLTGVAQ